MINEAQMEQESLEFLSKVMRDVVVHTANLLYQQRSHCRSLSCQITWICY